MGEMVGFVIFVIVIAVLGFGFWSIAMSMDKDRISEYIRQRGGRVISISWAPYGKGWIGEREDRIYEVVYYDADGRQHMATCKTSYWGGVYWTEDRVTHSRPGWYSRLPTSNERGNSLLRHIPSEAEQDHVENAAEAALGLSEASSPSALDEEIDRLKGRLADLERRKREGG